MAAGNGAQELEKLEAALTGMRPRPAAVAEAASDDAVARDFLTGMASMLDWGRRIGNALGDSGSYDREEAEAFLRSLEAQAQQWASDLLARKRRDLANLEKLMGKAMG